MPKKAILTLSIALAGIFAVVVVFLISFSLSKSVSLDLVSKIQSLVLRNLTMEIENLIEDITRPLVKYAESSELSLYINKEMDDTALGLLQWGISNAYNLLSLEGYEEIFVMLPDNRVVSKTGLTELSIPDEVISAIRSGKKKYDIYMPYEYPGKQVIVVLSKIAGADAILIGLYPSGQIEKLVSKLRFGESGYVALVYGTKTITHPNKEYIGNFDLSKNEKTKILAQEILSKEKGTVIYYFEEKKFAAFERISNFNLTAVAIMSFSEIASESHRIVRSKAFSNFITILGVLLSLLLSIIIILYASIIEKNAKLTKMVSELNEMNSELEVAYNELEETQNKVINSEKMAALGKLMVNIAHDVNTPAGIIYSSLTEIEHMVNSTKEKFNSGELTEEEFKNCLENTSQLIEIMLRNTRRITDLVQSLKRVALNETIENYLNININSLVNDVLNAMYPKLRRTKIEITTEIQEDLIVNTIPAAIAQILMNLIDNSLTHAFDEDTPGIIKIKFEKTIDARGTEYLSFVYSDNGKGIDPDVQKHVFEPFFTTLKDKGTGLGLSIVYNLVTEKLGGEIKLESNPGNGTTIYVKIPLRVKS
ncbi:ATP-binding protein [Fervidobacterium sp.]